MSKTLLIIDDETNMRHMLKSLLQKSSYSITEAENGKIGIDLARKSPYDFILCDIKMPVLDGMEFLKLVKKLSIDSTIIMMSAYGSIDLAIEAMQQGAYDYISKPFKTGEVLLTLKKAEERKQLQFENKILRNEIKIFEKQENFTDIIGSSQPLKEVIKLAAKVAQHDTSVLITGESGTGKELIARGIHNHSHRASKPLVIVNCASIPRDLLESEFFGYTKGTFTGAESSKNGLFKEADGGTLFLDEIGELPFELQAKLLRVLQDGEIRQLGSNFTETVDVRVLAATAKNLNTAIEGAEFRQDLLYRINVVELRSPPLRERQADIPLLTQHFIDQLGVKMKSSAQAVCKDTLKLFAAYDWPGNIRELKNVIEHALIYSDDTTITLNDLPAKLRTSTTHNYQTTKFSNLSLKEGKIQMEKDLIQRALEKTKGNKSQAAELLELSYPSLLAKIKEYYP